MEKRDLYHSVFVFECHLLRNLCCAWMQLNLCVPGNHVVMQVTGTGTGVGQFHGMARLMVPVKMSVYHV